MATTISPQRISREGIDRTATTPAAADVVLVENDGNVWIEIVVGAVACSVKFTPAITFGGFDLAAETLDCAANSETVAGPFPPAVFGGSVSIAVTGSDISGVSLAAFGI